MQSDGIIPSSYIFDAIREIERTRENEIVKFIRHLRSKYMYVPYDEIYEVATNDGYSFGKSEYSTFLDADKCVPAIEYIFYACRLNIIISSRTVTISEHYIVRD